jgi:hypothetical protein
MPMIVRSAVHSGIFLSAAAASCLSKGHSKKVCKDIHSLAQHQTAANKIVWEAMNPKAILAHLKRSSLETGFPVTCRQTRGWGTY